MRRRICTTTLRLQMFLGIIGILFIVPLGLAYSAELHPQIQELHGAITEGQGRAYTLSNLKKGDTLYAYMANTRGNLDPVLGVLKKDFDSEILHKEFAKVVENPDVNLLEALARLKDEHFMAWDDDGGDGYDAMLKFSIPADGTYYLFAGSMIANLYFDAFKPHVTTGSYRLLLGLNAPSVETGEGEPTDSIIATVEEKYAKSSVHVQHLDQNLTTDKQLIFHYLRELEPGDTVYARLEGKDDNLLPRFYLSDFGGKLLVLGDIDETSNSVTFSYSSPEGAAGLVLTIDGNNADIRSETRSYRLTLGLNAPEVLQGGAEDHGISVVKESKRVNIELFVDQIVNVDQQSENFTVVGSLQLQWQDSALAFSPAECNCAIKKRDINDIKSLSGDQEILLPVFTFFNQQGNRWSQDQVVIVDSSGKAYYQERFTVTLQAPDFDFRAYPFDHQKFHVRIDLTLATEIFSFHALDGRNSSLGEQLGEEQWLVVQVSKEVTEVPFDNNLKKSRFTMTLEMKRNLNYYLYRIFIPIFLIIGVSWSIFFLKDYGRQLGVASGNLMVFVAFNFTISDDLPRLGYLTSLDRLIISSFACAALVVFISVYQKRLEAKGKKELAARIDNLVLIFYPLIYVFLVSFEYFVEIRKVAV